jgi:hypothetical protein
VSWASKGGIGISAAAGTRPTALASCQHRGHKETVLPSCSFHNSTFPWSVPQSSILFTYKSRLSKTPTVPLPFIVMLFHAKAVLLVGLFCPLALAQFTGFCGVNNPQPCSSDSICQPDDPSCTDLTTCRGTCTLRNRYRSCGGFRIQPRNCFSGQTCIDDTRIPGNCGMACDAPGICVSNSAATCGKARKCRRGLWCYTDPRTECALNGGQDCPGICL